ncbi:hypothetical protein Gpo141_00012061 [Globisporangium polare]
MMLAFVGDYCNFTVEGRKVSKDWMAEMYGYSVAAANHAIKHTILTYIGITYPYLAGTEYCSFLEPEETQENPCSDPINIVVPKLPPVGLHFCHLYFVSDRRRYFYKRTIPNDILECNSGLLAIPDPAEFDKIKTLYLDNPVYHARKRHEVWMSCAMHKTINRTALVLRDATCADGYNTTRGFEMFHPQAKTHDSSGSSSNSTT